jgi:uncharacterized protein
VKPPRPLAHPVEPVPVSDRIAALDALRGFALLGVLVVHANQLAANVSTPSADAGLMINAGADLWADRFVRTFVEGKAQTLFTVLFGVSFAIQMARLESRLDDAVSVYRRRLFGLLIIGALHILVLWSPDILLFYAIGGYVLLLVRSWETRALVGFGSLLALVVMPMARLVDMTGHSTLPGTLGNSSLPALYQYGSYLEIQKMRWPTIWFVHDPLHTLLTFGLYVVGRFMLGVAVIRTGVLTEPARYRSAVQWTAAIALMAGIVLTEAVTIVRFGESLSWIGHSELWRLLALCLHQAGTLLLAAGYAALFALLWQAGLSRRLLSIFAPIGQTAVTNYLLQSAFLSFVFYGFGLGLLGHLGSTWCLLVALGFFSLQCIVSHLWMRSFQFGPVEWLWRAWTYGKRPPWRRVSRSSAGA